MKSMIPKDLKYKMHYDDVRGGVLRPLHAQGIHQRNENTCSGCAARTTPTAVEVNKF